MLLYAGYCGKQVVTNLLALQAIRSPRQNRKLSEASSFRQEGAVRICR